MKLMEGNAFEMVKDGQKMITRCNFSCNLTSKLFF